MFKGTPWSAEAFGMAVPHLLVASFFRSYADVPVRAVSGVGWLGAGVAVDAYAPAPSGPPGYAVILAGNLEGIVAGVGGVPVAPLAVDASTRRLVTLALRLDLLGVPSSARPPGACWAMIPQPGAGPSLSQARNSSDASSGLSVTLTVELAPLAGGAFVLTAC